MKNSIRVLALMAVALMLLSVVGCAKLKARDQLNKGVASYKNNRYEEAIDHFQQAVALDPNLLNAKLYLATAYTQQYIPGVDSPDNVRNADQAIEQYKAVLDRDPKNVTSVKGIGYLYLQMKKFDDAKEYYGKAADFDPNDPESYYTVGVIDWTEAYQQAAKLKADEGIKVDDDPGKNKKLCAALAEKETAPVQDGINVLNKALQLRADYDDAMAYMNLLYRRKADVDCANPAAREEDLKAADMWTDKTLAIKKEKAEKQPGATGIVMDQDQGSK